MRTAAPKCQKDNHCKDRPQKGAFIIDFFNVFVKAVRNAKNTLFLRKFCFPIEEPSVREHGFGLATCVYYRYNELLEYFGRNEQLAHKYVYLFNEGNASMRNLLGGKGANLAEMTGLGLPVPFGFTVSTEACTRYYADGKKIAEEIIEQIFAALEKTEADAGKKFGDPANPFLVSVRSGARASMPGMMDTILNLGLNDETVQGLAKLTNNERFAYDSYRRFINNNSLTTNIDQCIACSKIDTDISCKTIEKTHINPPTNNF